MSDILKSLEATRREIVNSKAELGDQYASILAQTDSLIAKEKQYASSSQPEMPTGLPTKGIKIKRAATAKTPGYGSFEVQMPTGLPAGVSVDDIDANIKLKKAKRKASTLIASQDPAALEAYTDKALIDEYKAAMKEAGIEIAPSKSRRVLREDAVRWATEQAPANGLRQGASRVVDAFGHLPAWAGAAAGGLIHDAARGASRLFGGDYGGRYMVPADVPAIVSDLQRKQEQTDLQTAAQGDADTGRGFFSDLGAVGREMWNKPGETLANIGEGMMNPRDGFWNAVPMAAPMKLFKAESKAALAARKALQEAGKTATGDAAAQIAKELAELPKPSFARRAAAGGANALAEGALYGTAQELIGQGENARGSDIAMNAVLGAPFGAVTAPKWADDLWDKAAGKIRGGADVVGKKIKRTPKAESAIGPDAFEKETGVLDGPQDGELGRPLRERGPEQDAKNLAEREAILRNEFADELLAGDVSPNSPAIVKRIQGARAEAKKGAQANKDVLTAGKIAEEQLELMRQNNPEAFAEIDAMVADRNAKAQQHGIARVYTAADVLADTPLTEVTVAKPRTQKQIAAHKAAVTEARTVHAIPESLNETSFGAMTDADIKRAMKAQVLLQTSGESMDGLRTFSDYQTALKERDAARAKTAPADEAELKMEKERRDNDNKKIDAALDVFGMRRTEGKTFKVTADRAGKIHEALKVDDGRVTKRLLEEGYSQDDVLELEQLANNTDAGARKAIQAILDGKPLWAAPELEANAARESAYRTTENRERARAISGTLDEIDAIDKQNASIEAGQVRANEARQANYRTTENRERARAIDEQLTAREDAEARVYEAAGEDLADTQQAKNTAERDELITKMIPTMDEKRIVDMLMEMLIENPARAAFLWGDDLRRSFARAAASADKHVSKQGKINLAEALKGTAAVVKKMGRLPKGF